MRIGVISDSHYPEFARRLPPGVLAAFEGVDLILHGGDITGPAVLERLSRIAPIQAVRGNHDAGAFAESLPWTRVIEVEGVRIGLAHGKRPFRVEVLDILWGAIRRRDRLVSGGFRRALRRQFDQVDCIVYGHLHEPAIDQVGDVLYFSPGSTYHYKTVPWTRWNLLRRPHALLVSWAFQRAYRRYRLRPRSYSVGLLEVADGQIRARILPLDGSEPLPAPWVDSQRVGVS